MLFRKYFLLGLCLVSTVIGSVYSGPSKDTPRRLNQAMQSMCNQNRFSGVVLVSIKDKIIFKKTCGLSNRSLNVPNTLNTKFNLGSVGKLFTAVAIAQLIQQNKIALSTPVFKIIPTWLPNDERSKTVTVEHLLTHASGLGNFMDDSRWKLGADSGFYNEIKDYRSLLHDDKFLFNPGSSQKYSNNGYILLGAIIEAVTHTRYADYLTKHIFKPCGMDETGIWALDEIVLNRSEGYFEECKQGKCQWKNNSFQAPFMGSSAGGAYSTVDDLFKFSQHLHQDKLLTNPFTREIVSTNTVTVSNNIKIKSYKIDDIEIPENFSSYGFAGAWNKYGFAVWKNPSLVGHTGGIQGASAFFSTSPDGMYTIIILSNMGGSGPIKLYQNFRKILGFAEEVINY